MADTEQVLDMTEQATEGTAVQNAEFAEAIDNGAAGEENLDILLDITMPITVTLGKTEIPFRRLLQLVPGSVLELDKAVGQPMELYVQDIKFATGDVVVVNDRFGIRIREILGSESLKQAQPAAAAKGKAK